MKVEPIKQATDALLKPGERSLEVTGLGVIASLILAFWSLVDDGTLPLAEYRVFVAFLLVSAGGLVWRILKLPPAHKAAASQWPREDTPAAHEEP